LKPKVIIAPVKANRATSGSLTYTLKSAGGNIMLKFFGASGTAKGVSAALRSQRRILSGTGAGW
jgi:hypothetical protein